MYYSEFRGVILFCERITKLSKATVRQMLCMSSVWLISAIYGFQTGWSGPALRLLTLPNSPIPISTIEITWLSIVWTSGNILSIIVCTMAAQRWGRKPLFLVCCGILILSWLLNCLANTLTLLLMSKFFIGTALGIFDVLNCIYLSEISATKNRGVFVSIIVVFYELGIELEYLIGLYDSYFLLSAVPFMVSVLALCLLYYMVESPHYLIMCGKDEEAYKNLRVLDVIGDANEVTKEYEELVKYVDEEKSNGMDFLKYILLPQNYRGFVCLLVVNSLVYINGVSTFTDYEPILMSSFSNVDSELVLNMLGIIGLIGILCCPFIVKRWGRRSLMLNGFLVMGVLQIITCVCFYLSGDYSNGIPFVAEAIIFCVSLSRFCFKITLHPITLVLRSEMLPHKLKESGTSVVMIFKAVLNGMVSASFFPVASIGGYGLNFAIYSGAALVGAVYVYLFLEETKDKTLAEIKKLYMDRA